jgi:hypothetical protein
MGWKFSESKSIIPSPSPPFLGAEEDMDYGDDLHVGRGSRNQIIFEMGTALGKLLWWKTGLLRFLFHMRIFYFLFYFEPLKLFLIPGLVGTGTWFLRQFLCAMHVPVTQSAGFVVRTRRKEQVSRRWGFGKCSEMRNNNIRIREKQ